MANQKGTELNSLTSGSISNGDLFIVIDIDEITSPTGETKNMNFAELGRAITGSLQRQVDQLSSSFLEVSESLVQLSASHIYNDSTVPGADVKEALDNISASLGAGTSKESISYANSFSTGDVIYRTAGGYSLSNANTIPTAEALGVIESASTSSFTVVYSGKSLYASHSFTNGDILFLSDSTAGLLTTTAPSAVGSVSKPIATVLDANNLLVQNYRGLEISSGSGGGGGSSGGGGIQSHQCYVASGSELIIPLSPTVTAAESLVYSNGNLLSPTDYTLATNTLTLFTASVAGEELCVVDYGTAAAASGSGATVFTALTDTPANYTGHANKVAIVNPGETALEFIATSSFGGGGGGSTDFVSLTDTPANYTGKTLQYVRVNQGETALEFHSQTSTEQTIFTANTFNAGEAVYLSGSTWTLSDVSSDESSEVLGVVDFATASLFVVTYNGSTNIPSHGLGGDGDILFLSGSGQLTNVQPTSGISKPVATVQNSNNIIVHSMRGLDLGGDPEVGNLTLVSSSFTAVKDVTYYITGSGVTGSLPTNPGNGAIFEFNDYEGDWATNNVAISSIANIAGVPSQPLVLDKNFGSIKLRFFNNKYRIEA